MEKYDVGLIGLGVMGRNLVLNMERHGFAVAVFNRTRVRTDDFIQSHAGGRTIKGCRSLADLVDCLKTPRKVMLMVKAGRPVDDFIDQLIQLMDPGDIIIDGGNSHYSDTIFRTRKVERHGLRYIGTGVSGGEGGALNGPSIMPGGTADAWPEVKTLFRAIAAQAPDGTPCCDWVGPNGAGHFVKMVHNGMEYGDMQMIAEAYDLLRRGFGLSVEEIQAIFQEWSRRELGSYLVEITAEVLKKRDDETGAPMVDVILDTAGQKGIGTWTSVAALQLGVPAQTIAEAIFARAISAGKEERMAASGLLFGPETKIDSVDTGVFVDMVRRALYASKICSYAQGFHILRAAADEYNWPLDYGRIALLWRAGCVIRARFLDNITAAYSADRMLANLMLAPYFRTALDENHCAWRTVVSLAVEHGIPVPTFSSALAYYDSYRTDRLPANLLQAQRDYFGAHTYERIDRERGEFFHTDWPTAGKRSSGE